eukprot:6176666-Pleurochrysis_carterae.AAC.1
MDRTGLRAHESWFLNPREPGFCMRRGDAGGEWLEGGEVHWAEGGKTWFLRLIEPVCESIKAGFSTHANLVFVCVEAMPRASGWKWGKAHWADGGGTWFSRPNETGF